MSHSFESPLALDPRIISYIQSWISSFKMLIVSKSKCRVCKKAKELLTEVAGGGITPVVFEVDNYPQRWTKVIMKYLSAQAKVMTVPLIWINGKFIGGFDDIQQFQRDGRLGYLFGMLKKNRISTTYILPMLRTSNKNKQPNDEKRLVRKTPILRMHKSNTGINKQNRKSNYSRQNSVSYRPLTFSIDDDLKWDTSIQICKKMNRARARSLGNDPGKNPPSSSSKVGSKNWLLELSAQSVGKPKLEEFLSTSNQASLNRPLVSVLPQGSDRPRKRGNARGV